MGNSFKRTISVIGLNGNELFVEVASDHAEQFASRLRKTIKARRKWADKHDIHAYRVYDADLPDYAVAVEVFEEAKQGLPYVLVSEYQAPREIDPQKAARRFKDACAIAQALFDVPEDRLFTRVRKQEKGGSQYHREIHKRHPVLVEENTHLFEIDLSGYLDTGLFLDHRITRQLVGEMAKGKRFLNLFAYTGTASVYAAAGEALQTTTVDMSQTYLDWAQRNMKNSGFADATHRFVRADVLQWVEQQIKAAESFDELHEEFLHEEKPSQSDKALREKNSNKTKYPSQFMGLYDLVFLDPPTFSNSKTMGQLRGIFNVIMRSYLRKCHAWLMQVVRLYFREICAHSSSMRKRFLPWVYRCKVLLRKLFQKIFRVIHVFISAIYLLKSKLLLHKYTSFYV